MPALDQWKWCTKYGQDGDQSEEIIFRNLKNWEPISIPKFDKVDIAATMIFRKLLYKNKKLCRDGIPGQYRLRVWMILSGALNVPDRLETGNRYEELLKLKHTLAEKYLKEINMDITRALKGHQKFVKSTEGQNELRNVLIAFAIRSPTIGYVNSLCHIAAYFLLFYKEEEVFWLLCSIVDIVLPADYFTQSLLGVRADTMLLKLLVYQRLPQLHAHFQALDIDLYSVTLEWMMTTYILHFPKETIARIYDIIFLEGTNILISIGLALFMIYKNELLNIHDIMEMMTYLKTIGDKLYDNELLIRTCLLSKCKITKEDIHRRDIERKVMENVYIKELQVQQLYRADEDKKRKEYEKESKRLETEENSIVEEGIYCWKIPISSFFASPKKLKITIYKDKDNNWVIEWESKKKQKGENILKIDECECWFDMKHGIYIKKPKYITKFKDLQPYAFTLIHPRRSLDLICQGRQDFAAFRTVFYRLPFKNKESVIQYRRDIEKVKTLYRQNLEDPKSSDNPYQGISQEWQLILKDELDGVQTEVEERKEKERKAQAAAKKKSKKEMKDDDEEVPLDESDDRPTRKSKKKKKSKAVDDEDIPMDMDAGGDGEMNGAPISTRHQRSKSNAKSKKKSYDDDDDPPLDEY